MPHWSSSPEAGQELEVEYDEALQQYRQLVLNASPAEQYNFKRNVLTPLATDVRASRAHWRRQGEEIAAEAVRNNQPIPEGGRAFVKTDDNVEGFEAPGDPEKGEAVHTVVQHEDGTKELVTPQGGKRRRARSAEAKEDGE